jgi:hypothetical protein
VRHGQITSGGSYVECNLTESQPIAEVMMTFEPEINEYDVVPGQPIARLPWCRRLPFIIARHMQFLHRPGPAAPGGIHRTGIVDTTIPGTTIPGTSGAREQGFPWNWDFLELGRLRQQEPCSKAPCNKA